MDLWILTSCTGRESESEKVFRSVYLFAESGGLQKGGCVAEDAVSKASLSACTHGLFERRPLILRNVYRCMLSEAPSDSDEDSAA